MAARFQPPKIAPTVSGWSEDAPTRDKNRYDTLTCSGPACCDRVLRTRFVVRMYVRTRLTTTFTYTACRGRLLVVSSRSCYAVVAGLACLLSQTRERGFHIIRLRCTRNRL